MPALTFYAVIRILENNGFEFQRQRGSHRTYRGVVNGAVQVVVVSGNKNNDDVAPGTLSSIIRQSGLPRALFR